MPRKAAPPAPHPCLGSGCGHPESSHRRVRRREGPTQMVVWCAGCRRHEVWTARQLGSGQKLEVALARALLAQWSKRAEPVRPRLRPPPRCGHSEDLRERLFPRSPPEPDIQA